MKHVAALSSLPGMGPARLRAVLEGQTAEEAWERVRGGGTTGVPDHVAARWREAATTVDVDQLWDAHLAAGVRVLQPGADGWPAALVDDPEPPAVLFARGDVTALDGPRVAIIGTRRCSYAGREIARELGRGLADAGVRVVSGLALGIDGAAHTGALAGLAPPVGVVGTGLDVVYPRRHVDLWHAVGEAGVLLSEYPLGVWPERW